jgi:hypothetical protein
MLPGKQQGVSSSSVHAACCRRSAVSRQACQLVGALACALGLRMEAAALAFLPALFKVVVITVQARCPFSHSSELLLSVSTVLSSCPWIMQARSMLHAKCGCDPIIHPAVSREEAQARDGRLRISPPCCQRCRGSGEGNGPCAGDGGCC